MADDKLLVPTKGARNTYAALNADFVDTMVRAACAIYLMTGSQKEGYKVYASATKQLQMTNTNKSSASLFFKKPEVRGMLEIMLNKARRTLVKDYLLELGLNHADINETLERKRKSGLDALSDKEGKEDGDPTLGSVTDNIKELMLSENEQVRLGASKLMLEAHALKKTDKKDDTEKYTVYYHPMRLCDTCPNKDELLSRYQDEEDLEERAKKRDEQREELEKITASSPKEEEIENSEAESEDSEVTEEYYIDDEEGDL